jgi:hypothetical protein
VICIFIQEPIKINYELASSPTPIQQLSSIEEQKSNTINLQTNKTHPKHRKESNTSTLGVHNSWWCITASYFGTFCPTSISF